MLDAQSLALDETVSHLSRFRSKRKGHETDLSGQTIFQGVEDMEAEMETLHEAVNADEVQQILSTIVSNQQTPFVDQDHLWPGGQIPYVFSHKDDFSGAQLIAIENAIDYLNFHLAGCITFREALPSDSYVLAFWPVEQGCSTKMGYHGKDPKATVGSYSIVDIEEGAAISSRGTLFSSDSPELVFRHRSRRLLTTRRSPNAQVPMLEGTEDLLNQNFNADLPEELDKILEQKLVAMCKTKYIVLINNFLLNICVRLA